MLAVIVSITWDYVTLISNCRIYQGDAYLPLNHSWHHGDIIGY